MSRCTTANGERPDVDTKTQIAALALSAAGTTMALAPALALQPNAPFLAMQERMVDQWAAEDQEVDAKLAALKERFGKKPNIIMVLTDDIGRGSLGAYGGGKVVGMPTPNLDQMAADGMNHSSAAG